MRALKHIVADVKKKIVNHILDHDKTCGDDYGVPFHSFKPDLKVAEPILRDALNELFLERKVNVKDSIAGKLVFLNYHNPEIQKL